MSDVRYTSVADRAYRLLLRLYPREFRERFGGDMTDFFHDRRIAARQHGTLGVARVWASAVADVFRVSALERAGTTARHLRAVRDARHHTIHRAPDDARDEDLMATLMAVDAVVRDVELRAGLECLHVTLVWILQRERAVG